MSKLRFTVVACSGEDPSFPARELNEHAANSKGFMTPKNCEYPQELILQLQDGLCRLTQTHIATKIELFLSKSQSLHDATFQRLGFLTLKSNIESNYNARELKTVHIDNEATFVKLVMHQCYINERNIYSQVGVMAVNLCGEPLEGYQNDELPNHSTGEIMGGNSPSTRSIPKPTKGGGGGGARSTVNDDLSFDLRFDAKTAGRIKEIQIAKDQAVAMEDYDQAKRLKQMEEQLKSIGLQLARLEAQKRDAVANEDYDLAKRIKDEINMLEASVGSNESQPILAPVGSYPASSPAKNSSSQMDRTAPHRSQVLPRAGASVMTSSANFSPRDMYPEESVPAKRGHATSHEDQTVGRRSPSSNHHAPEDEEEEALDPAFGDGDSGGPNSNFIGIADAENLPDPEEIPPALAKESEELIDVIGPFFTRCFYSNLWNHRDAAIRKVTMELENYRVNPVQLLEVCSTLVQSGAGDRIAQVALSAFRLMDRMLPFAANVRRDDMCRILGNSMTQFVNKLGESQTKVRDDAAAILMRLASAKNVGVAFVASHLTKRSKKPLGLKFLLGRLLVINDLLTKFELLPDSDFSVGGIMSFLEDSNCFSHQSRQIRDAAKDITVALFLMVGDEVEGYLKSLRPKQLEEYQAAFEAAETSKASATRSNAAAPRNGSYAGNFDSNGGRQANKRSHTNLPVEMMNDDADDDDDESVDEYTCPFCGIVDEKFDSDLLDQHYWADCKMLTPCKMCGQIIEISGLNEHLLVECERKRNHKECPRCGEAITSKFYDKHVSLNDCLPRPHPKKGNRCPLCHDDIGTGKNGWKRHLLEEGCPNNPRS